MKIKYAITNKVFISMLYCILYFVYRYLLGKILALKGIKNLTQSDNRWQMNHRESNEANLPHYTFSGIAALQKRSSFSGAILHNIGYKWIVLMQTPHSQFILTNNVPNTDQFCGLPIRTDHFNSSIHNSL